MLIKDAKFIGSFAKVEQCPPPIKPEYAFIGRSNVGKSSLINMLVGRRSLAWTSNTPGKTQTLNYFEVNDSWYLVDLPGYGYAKISQKQRQLWQRLIYTYLEERENLCCVFHLIDARVPPQASDLAFAQKMGEKGVPFVIVFTKIDDRKYQKGIHIEAYKTELLKNWEELPPIFITSAEHKKGRDELLQFINEVNQKFVVPQ